MSEATLSNVSLSEAIAQEAPESTPYLPPHPTFHSCDCDSEHKYDARISGPSGIRHRAHVCTWCRRIQLIGGLAKSVQPQEADPLRLLLGLDFPSPRVLAKSADSGAAASPSSSQPTERWITVHPNGDNGKGVPIKIVQNHDKSWSVHGGAAGKLNGLRLDHVKSPEEYRHSAKQRAKEKAVAREQKAESAHAERIDAHAEAVKSEAAKSGQTLSPDEIKTQAQKRATDEAAQHEAARDQSIADAKKQKHQSERNLIETVAKAQGWDENHYSLSDEQRSAARDLAIKQASDKGVDDLDAHADKMVERLERVHHEQALRRAKEVRDNAAELILDTHEAANADAMGEMKVGDLVKQTLGDSGKGYVANLQDQAEARGMDLSKLKEEADAITHQNRLEHHGFDQEAAAKAEAGIARMQSGASQARDDLKSLQEKVLGGEALGGLAQLDTKPKAQTLSEAAALLQSVKEHESAAREYSKVERDAKDSDELDTLPATAVIQSSGHITREEALRSVTHDLEERRRQRAMGGLMGAFNAEDQVSPLVSHRLAGHASVFGNVGHLAGVRAPDPIMADVLGPHISAALMRRALEQTMGDDPAIHEGLRDALAAHHIDTQVEAARNAVASARSLREKADALEDPSLDTEEGMAAALENNELRLGLHQKAREQLGVTVGRLEAAAALNEILGRGKAPSEMQVALGAISMADAQVRAKALGLTKADAHDFSGQLVEAGQYHIHSDGKNKILVLHEDGLNHLASQLQESPEHLERARQMASIKSGGSDETGWLPQGFSPRPRLDASREDSFPVPDASTRLDLSSVHNEEGDVDESAVRARAHDYIAQRIEEGQDPLAIIGDMRTTAFKRGHVPGNTENVFTKTLDALAPSSMRNADGTRLDESQYKNFNDGIRERLKGVHADWLKRQVAEGKIDSEQASVHHQTLAHDWKTRDAMYQAALQDPRLQHAFTSEGELKDDVGARRAVRDYAAQHIFEETKADEPNVPLSPAERRAWDGWRDLQKSSLDPYSTIQEHWKAADEAQGGMFGPSEPHAFATLDMNDDRAVIEAARAHPQELGYTPERRVKDVHSGEYSDIVPGLETGATRSERSAANDARRRIKGALRDHAFKNMLGSSDLAGKGFNPENVASGAGDRWAEYVTDMGGEARAYRTVQETMKGDFAGRFAKAHNEWRAKDGEGGAPLQTVAVPLTHAEAHARASLSPEKRAAYDAQRASEQAKVRDRAGGKFAAEGSGAVAGKLEARAQAEQLGGALFGADEAKTEEEKQVAHRLSLGAAAEGMVKQMMPHIGTKRGTVAAGDIDMTSDTGIKRQRAIKQVLAVKRLGLTLSAGAGKTAVALAAHSELKAKNPNHRTLMAVPSAVQAQFGSEAARFYDPTDANVPKWHAEPGISPEERRNSYKADSGYDVNVVTHQALRDDLNWALAQHRFAGDEDKARDFLADAPEADRNAAVKAACAHQNWNHDMTIVDEGHGLLNRAGKENSAMANAIDGLTHDKEHHVSMSADPVKNDPSEAFDFLRKVAPQRYVADDHPHATGGPGGGVLPGVVTRGAFLRKYNTNLPASKEALQREMEPYHYAESIAPPVERTDVRHVLQMPDDQRSAYSRVHQLYRRARGERKRGGVDVQALKELSPNSFVDVPADQHEAVARRLHGNLGIARDTALDRVVNMHPSGAKMQQVDKLLREKPPANHPHVIFAHSLAAVDALHEHLTAQGHRVGKLRGDMNGEAKDAVKDGFSPQFDPSTGRYVSEPQYDILVASDCASTGMNMQRGSELTHFDTPHTAMTFQQRSARIHRTGQQRDVTINHLTTDTLYEHRRVANLERKNEMREALTTPAERLDDSGLAHRIAQETDNARARHIGQSARALATARNTFQGDETAQAA